MMDSDHSEQESGFCDNFGDPANIHAIADIVTDHDMFFFQQTLHQMVQISYI